IIKSLGFRGLYRRQGAIPDAYDKAFEWIFQALSRAALTSTDIYWITGKLGAGKSTLMKFLIEHRAVREHLEHWSSNKQLVFVSFYFWNAGSEMQRTQEGLLRTILGQVLTQIPSIVSPVCPRRWAWFKFFGEQAIGLAPKRTWEELIKNFSALSGFIGDEFQLALFIDGLDEFEGRHETLIDFIRLLQARPGTKICVSSRPLIVFTDAFTRNPCLRVEDLTRADIETFARGEFGRTVGFRELRDTLPSKASQLIKDVVTKANGVFLWVSLVARTLCEGFTDGDSLSSLQATLDDLPSDLHELYQRIWRRISPKHLRDSCHLFRIQYASTQPLHATTFWLADEYNMSVDIVAASTAHSDYILGSMRRRLNSRTQGLLEVSHDDYVDYLHRSVRE
ncbi:hypothetical protein EDB81DRAFT_641211, partial [Dactylonectria macrodidyma]